MHGGRRSGAGRKVGPQGPRKKTIAKEEAREAVRKYITRKLKPMLDAHIENAIGIRHLMMRDPKTGKFERVTGTPDQIDKAVKSKNAFWIYTKDPSVQAFTELLNRALDRPAEQIQIGQKAPPAMEVSIKVKNLALVFNEKELDDLEQRFRRIAQPGGDPASQGIPPKPQV